MAALVLSIRKTKNADNSNPYAVVNFINIQKSDLEIGSTKLEDSNIYSGTYDLSLIYPEIKDEKGNFNYEEAYSCFIKEMQGVQEDVRCIIIPLSSICKHDTLINRNGGTKITNLFKTYYTDKNIAIDNMRVFVNKQISQGLWIIPDNSFKKFIIDGKDHYVRLAKIEHIHNKTDKASVGPGSYVLNALHNYKYGICYKHNDDSYEVIVPFIYDKVINVRLMHTDYELPIEYYFAKRKSEEGIFFSIYAQILMHSCSDETIGALPCISNAVNKAIINEDLNYIIIDSHEKKGVIRNGEVFIKPLYSSIEGYRMIVDSKLKEEHMIIFVVSVEGKEGLYLENEEIIPPEYDSIIVEENTGICTLVKDNRYYVGGFQCDDLTFSMREFNEEEYRELEEHEYEEELEEDDIDKDFRCGHEWTDEDTWIALTDGQFGPYPEGGVNWDYLDDFQGR